MLFRSIVVSGKMPKAGKRKKERSGPKRPPTAFFLFSADHRAQVKKENPEMKVTEVSKKLGEMWRGMAEDEKKPYLDEARKRMEEYKALVAAAAPEEEEHRKVARRSKKTAPAEEEGAESDSDYCP